MNYNDTTNYKNEQERIKSIAEDILSEYSNLGFLALEVAKLENPFGIVHDDYNRFNNEENNINRLNNIVIVTEGKPEFYSECKKLVRVY